METAKNMTLTSKEVLLLIKYRHFDAIKSSFGKVIKKNLLNAFIDTKVTFQAIDLY
jgi:hypothetical protein